MDDIEYITLDSEESSIDLTQESIQIIEEEHIFSERGLKRDRSEASIILLESSTKKSKSKETETVSPITKKKTNVITLREFYDQEPMLSQKNEFNHIDDFNLDIELLVWCEIETILDLICTKQICYTVEHYYHMLLRKKIFLRHQNEYNSLFDEYRKRFENSQVVIENREIFLSERNKFRQLISEKETLCRESLANLKSLVNLLKNIYGNKIIIPMDQSINAENDKSIITQSNDLSFNAVKRSLERSISESEFTYKQFKEQIEITSTQIREAVGKEKTTLCYRNVFKSVESKEKLNYSSSLNKIFNLKETNERIYFLKSKSFH
ncbi:unnamed protein product [Brachionus calyciflorus]|uniref:Uncharacterized protein n=1 Tax=Brachionus calyciflorus TaxID=104777 RepID=A0A814FE56_9BILA|nr:unnamed protein product [Brachionus calyciflorus]